jgi:uncharacterized membrane protein YuzA (DUF378 family)
MIYILVGVCFIACILAIRFALSVFKENQHLAPKKNEKDQEEF